MKYKTVGFSKTYALPGGGFQKQWIEGELEEGDNARDCFYKCKREVEGFFFESTKAEEKKKDEILPVGNLIEDINSCSDLKILESYRLIVKNKPDLQSAWDIKYEELKK